MVLAMFYYGPTNSRQGEFGGGKMSTFHVFPGTTSQMIKSRISRLLLLVVVVVVVVVVAAAAAAAAAVVIVECV